MAETTADVRRDIELTRDRISNTLNQLEQKVNVTQIVKDNPWPAVGLALGAGFLLSGSRVDVKASATTLAATKGASSRLGTVLDDLVANLMGGLSAAFEDRVEGLVTELKTAIGAPTGGSATRSNFSSAGTGQNMGHQMATASGGAPASSSSGMSAGGNPSSSASFGATATSAAAAPGYETRAD
jgi:hypothetical protein